MSFVSGLLARKPGPGHRPGRGCAGRSCRKRRGTCSLGRAGRCLGPRPRPEVPSHGRLCRHVGEEASTGCRLHDDEVSWLSLYLEQRAGRDRAKVRVAPASCHDHGPCPSADTATAAEGTPHGWHLPPSGGRGERGVPGQERWAGSEAVTVEVSLGFVRCPVCQQGRHLLG